MKLSPEEKTVLLKIIAQFRRQHVVVWGDMVADEFVYGEISRVSREAPVLILKHRESRVVPGGGANAVYNLADLGARVTPVGVVGEDPAGRELLKAFTRKGIGTRAILKQKSWVTTTKSRILAGSPHSHRQQIVRVDREPPSPLAENLRRRLQQAAAKQLSRAQALLVSDYGYGAVNAASLKALFPNRRRLQSGSRRRELPVTVDSRYELASYQGLTAATPNEPEIEAAFGVRLSNKAGRLPALGQKILKQLDYRALVVTRGPDGMMVFEPNKRPSSLPIFGSDEVADVTGAGDTVIAAFTLALAAGANYLDAARIANCAAGLVVMKRGTATVKRTELEEAVRRI